MKELNRKNIEDVAALTSMQEGMLFHYLKDPGSDAYFEQLSLGISGRIDDQIFKQAWNVITRSNEMLRTVFRWEYVENPIQIVLKEHQLQPKYYDFSRKEVNEAARALEEIKIKDKKKNFDLHEVPFRVILCKIQESKYEMIVSNHHILYDGWSNGIILKEFVEAYEALICREYVFRVREHPKTKFKEFVKWHQNRDIEKEKQFWRSYFQGIDTQIGLSVKRSKKRNKTCSGSHQVRFKRGEKDRVEDFVKRYQLTLASLFYSAWGILLQKYNSSDDVIFGTTVSGRTAKINGIEDIVGLFINTLPLRVQTTPGETIKDLLHRVDNVLRVREEFENSSLVDIKKYSDIDIKGELFDSIVILENYPLQLSLNNRFGEEKGRISLAVESYSMVEETHYDLTVMIRVFEGLEVLFIYNECVFYDECIVNMSHYFMKIIRETITNPNGNISDIEIITSEEKNRILYDFNNTGVGFPDTRIIHQLFEKQAEGVPDRVALVGQDEGWKGRRVEGKKEMHLSYRELNEKTHRLACLLREKGVKPDTIVGIMVERSMEMVIGIIGILKAGGAYLPIDPDYPENRVQYMLSDSGAKILLTGQEIEGLYSPQAFKIRPKGTTSHLHLSPVSATSLAYIIYTSGSTGSPKGVLVEHSPVVNLLAALQKAYPFRESDTYLLKTSYSFDVSVTELFGWFWQGGKLAVLEAGEEKDPVKIIDTIERFRITHINFVPSMFNVFVEQLLPSDTIKLSCLKYIFLAGEAVLAEVINKFRHLNTAIVLENIYGPTEGTVYSSKYSLSHWDGIESIPIGKPMQNILLFIVNRNHHLQPVGIPGELVISGIGLARGYLNNPELTCEKFKIINYKLKIKNGSSALRADLNAFNQKLLRGVQGGGFLEKSPPGRRRPRIYQTGDLARWLPGGNIEFLGRMDQQVKVRGFRIELGEIENHLMVIDEIKEAVVLSREDKPGDKYLCAYIVSQGELEQSILRDHLSGRLPAYMVPSYFVQLEEIPLTPNGKVDRKALPRPVISVGNDYTAPRDEIEEKLVEIWLEILCCTSLGIDDNFFELGGHSLNATRLVSRIHKELNVMVPLQKIFTSRTIRILASYLKGMKKSIYFSIEMKEKWEYYPLSPAQERMYILHQTNPDQLVYNMPKVMVLEGELKKSHIEAVFQKLIQRHESLRTSFHLVDEVPVQVVHEGVEFEIQYYDLQVAGASDRCRWEDEGTRGLAPLFIKNFIRPFDLSKAPLLRVGLIELLHTPADLRDHPRRGTYYSQGGKERKYILMLDMHHIISDGVSIGVFIRDFIAIYSGKELGPIGINYKDFSCWQNSSQWQETIKNQGAYWLKQFEDEIPVLNLPLDYIPPKMQRFEGHTLHFELGRGDTETLNIFVKKEGITLYMSLLAAFNILVGKLSGQDDILVGTPSGGRKHPDLENIMGMFVNTLVLRSIPAGYKMISIFLKEIKEITLGAFENRDYPFEELVRHLVKERETSRNPLFDVMFTLRDLDMPFIPIPGVTVTPLEYNIGISKFDLTIIGEKAEEKMLFSVEYRTRLFKETTIRRFMRYFETIVSQVVRVPGISISEIELMSEEEKEEILFRFNDIRVDYPVHKTIYQLFEEQAKRTPGHIAVIGQSLGAINELPLQVTYNELNQESNRLAHLLMKKGVKPDTIVAIMMKRSNEMIIGIMGILKAGSAYLPIDPDYPQERIDFMLRDSGAKIHLTSQEITGLDSLQAFKIRPKGTSSHLHLPPWINAPATSLAYIIYTSGSTGKPKGVMLEHSPVVNLAFAQKRRFNINTSDRILQFSSICFDASVEQIFIALFSGAALILIDKDTLLDTIKFESYLSMHSITHVNAVPSFLNHIELKERERYSLRRIISGGDVCPVSLARKLSFFCDFYNQYGPTETTVTSIAGMIGYEEVEETLPRLPIGRPIDNTMVYVLDKWMKPVCLGTVGELYIGGAGVARGYLNNPELTAEKFDQDFWDYQDYQDDNNQKLLQGVQGDGFLEKSPPGRRRQKIYKTGDLARWLVDGNIEFLGRIDHQVKIRGFRIELGEIESQLLKYPGIKDAVVIIRTGNDGDKHLCAYFTAGKTKATAGTIDIKELREFLSASLPDYMIPSYFLQLEQLPLTFNGKPDRKALPETGISTGKDYVAPRDKIEKKLAEIWWEILCIDASHGSQLRTSLGIHDNFFALGGHSLKATILASRVRKEFNVKFSLSNVFSGPTIKEISDFIRSARIGIYQEIQPVEKKDYYPQSSAQKRLYFLQQMDLSSTSYNMPLFLPLGKDIEKTKLEPAVKKLITRHESLRTSFVRVNDIPVQRVHDRVEFEIEYLQSLVNCQGRGEVPSPNKIKTILREFVRPFDLSQAPLLRVGLIELLHTPAAHRSHPSQEGKEWKYILMVDMHHIISDGTSTTILVEDFLEIYPGVRLPGLRLQYKDFSQWQNRLFSSSEIKAQENYWRQVYKESVELPRLQLPVDYKRPGVFTFSGDHFGFILERTDASAFKALGSRNGATLYMNILALLNVLFYKITSQTDIVIGTGIAGRPHADLQGIIGMFVNTLAMRNYPHGEKTYEFFLKEVAARSVEAFENQDLQFEELVEKLEPQRDPSRNPLFDISMVVQNFNRAGPRGFRPGNLNPFAALPSVVEKSSYDADYKNTTSKFDMTFFIYQHRDNIVVDIEYYTAIFKKETIQRLASHFINLVKTVIKSSFVRLKDIDIISEEEKNHLLYELNDTVRPYPGDKTIPQLFADQVKRTPDHTALVGQIPNSKFQIPNKGASFGHIQNAFGEVHISYKELNARANQLANYLVLDRQFQQESLVGILMERSIHQLAALLGVLKSGGAYLPIDPSLPGERIKNIIDDARVEIIISQKRFIRVLNPLQWWAISTVEFSNKIYTIENELTKFWCDVLITIDKRRKAKKRGKPESRNKYQQDGKALIKFSGVPVETAVKIKPENLAYVIYTSGSTGSSKGVMVTHQNVLRLVKNANYIDYIDFKGGERFLLSGAFSFDITTFEIWGLLLNGIYLYMVDKDVILEGERLQEEVVKHDISIMHFIPQLFNHYAVNFPGIFAALDCMLIGGDMVSAETLSWVRNKYNHLKILHMYGPTENTTFSTYFPVESDYDTVIPIGKPISNTTVYILNNYHQLQPIGVVGELCTGGEGVARGYLNNPGLTFERFTNYKLQNTNYKQCTCLKIRQVLKYNVQNYKQEINKKLLRGVQGGGFLEKRPPGRRRQKIYHTGDLVRWLPDGNIEFLGRADFQVKIRGFRIELEEIRYQLLKHELIKDVVVIDRQEEDCGKYLCAYFVSKKTLDISELNDFLSHRLPDYMIPSYFLPIDKIPVNPNGKVDRKALPAPEAVDREEYARPRNDLEKKLVEIWSAVLGERIFIALDDNFFEIGGHSLKATILTANIHKELGIKVPLAEIFKHQTIRQLSGYIQRVKGCRQEYISIMPVEKKDYYILSSAQERLYVLHQLDNQGIGYNLSAVVLLEGKLDIVIFKENFLRLILRHESLRTSFHLVDEEPVQVVHDEVEFDIEYDRSLVNCQGRGEVSSPIKIGTIIREFLRSFDLSRAPLLRVRLIELPHTPAALRSHPSHEGKEPGYILMIDMHHIISDGTSLGIITREFMVLYAGEALPMLRLQYKDYSEWQHNERQERAVKVQEKYWLKQFEGDKPVLNLPYDYARPQVQGFTGGTIKFKIGKARASALKALALQQETTLYMLLLSIYYVFLAKLSGQEDIIVGTPTAGRRHADLQQVIGMFVNTLVLRNFPTGNQAFKRFLEELKQRTLEAYENQEYQFGELVEKVVVERDASRNPLFDTMFALQNLDIPEVEIPGLKVKPYDHEGWTAVFDLVLEVNEVEEGLLFKFSYSTGLFRKETIQRFIRYFKGITADVLKHSEIKLSQIEMIPEEEKRKILVDFNERETRYPNDKMLHELFAEQVEQRPNQVALAGSKLQITNYKLQTNDVLRTDFNVFGWIYLTYKELNEKSNLLAHLLIEKGVKSDTIVAIMVERSVEMIIGILGILKAGGAYLPIDPGYPEERINYMLKESGAEILLKDNDFTSEAFNNCPKGTSSHLCLPPAPVTSLAYIIYTSGTTGKPKGVLVSHANVSPLLHWGKGYLGISSVDRVIQNFSYYFDGSVWEIFVALITGAGLYLIPKEMVPHTGALVDFINTKAITMMLITPTQYQYLIHKGKRLDTLRYLFIGAEKLTVDLVRRSIESVTGHCRIFNMYGPTEAAVISTAMEIDRQDIPQYKALSSVPIGRPVGNTVLLILDNYLQLCPIGVTGELVITGDAVSRGYLNYLGLTCEKFKIINYKIKINEKLLQGVQGGGFLEKSPPGRRRLIIYRTGDLARWLGDGTIEFLGRLDHQVKIRGFRIELGEIENRLLDHQDIREAIVIDRESKKGEKYLCAYIVPEDINQFDNNGPQSMVSQLRSYLSRELPDYMIPSYFVRLDNIPLNSNGKLSRKALPEPEVNIREAHIAPGNELEETLADIWAEVLGIEKDIIGIDTDFFQLGGHSLKATFMLAKIRNEFNIDISLGDIFKTPSIRGIASLIKAVHWAAHQKRDINQEREEIIL